MLNLVGNWCCSRALDWSSEAGCLAEAGFPVNQTIIIQFYVIIKLLMTIITVIPVMTVKMALLLQIFASALRHHYVLLPVVTVIMELLL